MTRWRRLNALFAIPLISALTASPPVGAAERESPSWRIEDLTWPEIDREIKSGKTTAIIMAGSTEEGGPHVALGKHNVIARYVGERVARELGNALVYPVMPFAPAGDPEKKSDLMEFPGTVSISDRTFGSVAHDVARSAIAAGFKNVILAGEHGGGQAALKEVARRLDAQWSSKGIHVYFADYKETDLRIADYCKEHGLPIGEHAGIQDTPKLMYLDLDHKWVRTDKIAPGGKWEETGVDGDPTRSTAELGKIFLDFEVQSLVEEIRAVVPSQ